MKLEATKFRLREVVKHVLQMAAASLQKILTLEGHVSDDVPIEVKFSQKNCHSFCSGAVLCMYLSFFSVHVHSRSI